MYVYSTHPHYTYPIDLACNLAYHIVKCRLRPKEHNSAETMLLHEVQAGNAVQQWSSDQAHLHPVRVRACTVLNF